MKTIRIVILSFLTLVAVFGVAQQLQAPQQDPVVNLRIPLSKTQQVVYAIRYSQVLDAKTANELADMVVNQVNDTILNKQLVPPTAPKAPTRQK